VGGVFKIGTCVYKYKGSNWNDSEQCGTKLTPLLELYKETRFLKLKDRRENHKLIQLFKMQNALTLASLSTLIPNRFQDVHTYNTKHYAFLLPRTWTLLYASYFLPSTLKLCNSLPLAFLNLDLLLDLIMIMYLNIIIMVLDWHKYYKLFFVWEVVL
jgi:hypothetical protein